MDWQYCVYIQNYTVLYRLDIESMYETKQKETSFNFDKYHTIKGGSRRAEKSRKVLMMMKAAKQGWAGTGVGKKQGWTKNRSRAGAGQEQGRSRNWAGVG